MDTSLVKQLLPQDFPWKRDPHQAEAHKTRMKQTTLLPSTHPPLTWGSRLSLGGLDTYSRRCGSCRKSLTHSYSSGLYRWPRGYISWQHLVNIHKNTGIGWSVTGFRRDARWVCGASSCGSQINTERIALCSTKGSPRREVRWSHEGWHSYPSWKLAEWWLSSCYCLRPKYQ